MRRVAFVVMIAGMFVLFLILGLQDAREVSSYADLEDLEINKLIRVSGEVVSERLIYSGVRLLVLENGVELVCSCLGGFVGKEVIVDGVVS